MLDIGDDIGALMATMDAETDGTELHLRSEHEPPVVVHTGVWQRGQGAGVTTVAVFPELREGIYWVRAADGGDVCRVEIRGGEVSTVDLRRETLGYDAWPHGHSALTDHSHDGHRSESAVATPS